MLQSTGVDPYLTVRETVELYAGYYPKPRDIDEVIEVVGLEEKRDTRVDKLSGGQQRRLDVAIGAGRATPSSSSWTSRPPGSIRARVVTRGRSSRT